MNRINNFADRILLALVVIAIILCGRGYKAYNKLVEAHEQVENAASNIAVMVQRRADIIPGLLQTVEKYADNKEAMISAVNAAVESLEHAVTVEDKLRESTVLTKAVEELLTAADSPELKSNSHYTQLLDELAGSENRIAIARKDYNESVSVYNMIVKKLPGSIFAKLLGFDPAPYFAA